MLAGTSEGKSCSSGTGGGRGQVRGQGSSVQEEQDPGYPPRKRSGEAGEGTRNDANDQGVVKSWQAPSLHQTQLQKAAGICSPLGLLMQALLSTPGNPGSLTSHPCEAV